MKNRVQVFYRVLYARDLFQPAFLLFSMMKESLWGIRYQSLKNNAGNSAGTKISEKVSRLLHPVSRNTHVHREERRLFKSGHDLSNLVQWKNVFVIFFRNLSLECTPELTVCSAGSYSIQNPKISNINRLTPKRPIYGSYRTANLQTLHFTYLFNKYRYWIF